MASSYIIYMSVKSEKTPSDLTFEDMESDDPAMLTLPMEDMDLS